MTVKADNEKIAAAMDARREARNQKQRERRAAKKAEAEADAAADVEQSQEAEHRALGIATAGEQIVDMVEQFVMGDPPEDEPAVKPTLIVRSADDESSDSGFAERALPLYATGKVLDRPAESAAQAVQIAGLGWEVGLRPLAVFDDDSLAITPLSRWQATYRKDNGAVLGVVQRRYHPVQNVDAFAPINPLIESGDLVVAAAGSFRGGATVWIDARIPAADFDVAGKDPVQTHIIIRNTHDGSATLSGGTYPVRLACLNMLPMVARGAQFRFRHTINGMRSIEEARRTLSQSIVYAQGIAKQADRLARRHMTEKAFDQFIVTLLPARKDGEPAAQTMNRRAEIRGLWEHSPNLDEVRGTEWAALNAVTEYADHFMRSRDTVRGDMAENRALSVIGGQAANLKVRAYSLLTASN